MPYEQVYGVTLLDDIHNYFPALLYEQSRFSSLAQVFHYVRSQMARRFNLYSYGASLYNESQFQSVPTTIPNINIRTSPIQPSVSINTVDAEENLAAANILLSLLGIGSGIIPLDTNTTTLPGRRLNPFSTHWNPVTVRPSQEVITSNTHIIQGSSVPSSSTCTICQDSINETDVCRVINHCNHIYHRSCIDQWFERSVYCPTCRHDIRSTTQPSNTNSQ